MKKQKTSSTKKHSIWAWIDNNMLHWAFLAFIVGVSVVPKFPIQHVEYTYIRIRIDDLLPPIMGALFTIQWLRRKIQLNKLLLIPFVLFWLAVFASFFVGHFIQLSIPIFNIGLLHSLRRVEYMSVFFIASSLITSEKRFFLYLKTYLWTLFAVTLYGIIQKFGFLPSIQSMNPAYVDGRLLWLNPEDRINSTFGGHFDLSAYATFSIPIVIGMYYTALKRNYLIIFFASLVALLYTAARSSFVAYVTSTTFMLFYIRKFKFWAVAMILTGILLVLTGDMTKRLLQTFQFKTVYTNQLTGEERIGQEISVQNLPAGSYKIDLPFLKQGDEKVEDKELLDAARSLAFEEARRSGRTLTPGEIEEEANRLTQFIKPENTLLCDISCATRLQVEWPRAILAFKRNVLFGLGPSSITEATDNDILRWLGEFGLVGTSIFLFILFRLVQIAFKLGKNVQRYKTLTLGYIFGVFALLVNALYIDVFEASKVAYNFWLVSGLFVGLSVWHEKNKGIS
jgi:hypothetical protein